MTSTVVVTAHPEWPLNIVRAVFYNAADKEGHVRETIIVSGASATLHIVGKDDALTLMEDTVIIVPLPGNDTS